jgi:GNAT superfamily N-acetyltransferase
MSTVIRPALTSEAELLCALIIDVFMQNVAPDYSDQGVQFFRGISTPADLGARITDGDYVFVAEEEGEVIGIIWTRDANHISRFFVRCDRQRHGVGKKLFARLIDTIVQYHGNISSITVNSSPFALKAYEKMGFVRTAEEQTGNGMRYIPMTYAIAK